MHRDQQLSYKSAISGDPEVGKHCLAYRDTTLLRKLNQLYQDAANSQHNCNVSQQGLAKKSSLYIIHQPVITITTQTGESKQQKNNKPNNQQEPQD